MKFKKILKQLWENFEKNFEKMYTFLIIEILKGNIFENFQMPHESTVAHEKKSAHEYRRTMQTGEVDNAVNNKVSTSNQSLSRRRPVVAIPGKGVRCQWGQFGMRASPYAPPNIDF